MATKNPVICDTNILIEYFKNNTEVASTIFDIGEKNILISSITAGELYYGAFNKNELRKIKRKLDLLVIIPINENICDIYEKLMYRFSLSHKISLPDAFIAAAALYYDLHLYTLNIRDFKFIPDIKLYKK